MVVCTAACSWCWLPFIRCLSFSLAGYFCSSPAPAATFFTESALSLHWCCIALAGQTLTWGQEALAPRRLIPLFPAWLVPPYRQPAEPAGARTAGGPGPPARSLLSRVLRAVRRPGWLRRVPCLRDCCRGGWPRNSGISESWPPNFLFNKEKSYHLANVKYHVSI